MNILAVSDLLVRRDGVPILDLAQLEVRAGEVLALIGPNGAGKSTLLLTLALLLPPSRGQIFFRGQAVTRAAELETRRQMALVLQDPLLLHGTVASNIAAGLRFRGLPKGEVTRRVNLWAERMGIAHLKDRPSRRLSGGEAQRTSLARALAIQPDVLLLDEPFSALDAPTRASLLQDLHALLQQTGVTTVFVTHDLDEALLLGDRVAVLIGGRLRQVGAPESVFTAPSDPEVARFVGVETVIAGRVASVSEGIAALQVDGWHLEGVGEFPVGAEVLLCLRPEDVTIARLDSANPEGQGGLRRTSARNRLEGRIVNISPQGPLLRVVVECPVSQCERSIRLVALVTRISGRELGLAEGQAVAASFKASAAHLIGR